MKINHYLASFLIVLFCVSGIKTKAQNKNEDIIDLSAFNNPLASIEIYSKNINIKKMEAFDIDKKGNIYYARLGLQNGGKQGIIKSHQVYIYKAWPNHAPKEFMILKYFGHPYNISVEEDGDEIYLWISSNGSKHKNGKYWDEPSVSRIKYEPGKIYEKGYGGSTYFLNNDDLQKTQVDINRKNNLMLIAAQSKNRKDWSFYTYNLKEAEALPSTTFTFYVTIGGEDYGSKEKTIKKKVQGKNLNQLIPINSFTVEGKRNDKPNALNSYWLQGFDIDDNRHIYFYEGEGNRKGRKGRTYITALDIDGNVVGERTRIKAMENKGELNEQEIMHISADIEPEGMTIKNGNIYLGFLSKIGKRGMRSTILKYKKDFFK